MHTTILRCKNGSYSVCPPHTRRTLQSDLMQNNADTNITWDFHLQYGISTQFCHAPQCQKQDENGYEHRGICEQVQQHPEQHILAAIKVFFFSFD